MSLKVVHLCVQVLRFFQHVVQQTAIKAGDRVTFCIIRSRVLPELGALDQAEDDGVFLADQIVADLVQRQVLALIDGAQDDSLPTGGMQIGSRQDRCILSEGFTRVWRLIPSGGVSGRSTLWDLS